MSVQKNIIIAPLNWGLGHATRCIPIINALVKSDFVPVIASDGSSLEFLKREFKDLDFIELPSYNISYGKNLKWSLFKKIPQRPLEKPWPPGFLKNPEDHDSFLTSSFYLSYLY